MLDQPSHQYQSIEEIVTRAMMYADAPLQQHCQMGVRPHLPVAVSWILTDHVMGSQAMSKHTCNPRLFRTVITVNLHCHRSERYSTARKFLQ